MPSFINKDQRELEMKKSDLHEHGACDIECSTLGSYI